MNTPQRPTPEDQGVPDHADDTSTAFSEAERPRFNDSPAPLPADEPQAVDDFGVTGTEARQGESLADRLAREEPDVGSATRENARKDPAAEPAVREVGEDDAPVGGGAGGGGLPAMEPPEADVPDVDPPEIETPETGSPEAGETPELDLPEITRTPEGGTPEGEFPDQP